MAIYIDDARIPWRGRLWCHMVADTVDELHVFAARLGLKRAWFQRKTLYPHYDVTIAVRQRALLLGAVGADKRVVIACAKGLRRQLNEHAIKRQALPASREETCL